MAEAQSSKRMKEKKVKKEEAEGGGKGSEGKRKKPKVLPSISIPDRSSASAVFRSSGNQVSKEALTLAEQDRSGRSFPQLLAGAMASPAAVVANSPTAAVLEMKPAIVLALAVDPAHFPLISQPTFIGVLAQGHFGMSHQQALASVTAQAQMQLHTGYSSPLVTPAKSLVQPLLSPLSPIPLQQRMPSVLEDNVSVAAIKQHTSPHQKPQSSHGNLKTPSIDGYNWRKYGQKQVKSSDSSRSYYRCTNANCAAKKKVERCHDDSIAEIIYKGSHNHEPPQKIRCRKDGDTSGGGTSGGTENGDSSGENLSELKPSTSRIEQTAFQTTPEPKVVCSNDSNGDYSPGADEDRIDEPSPKRRHKDITPSHLVPQLKIIKEPKVVVQNEGDPGNLGDGYRWRKYGQKIVKGNPNPRSYYKCTYLSCPVRKHVERASGDEKALIITYEGKHNHDGPTFKSSCDSSGTALAAAVGSPVSSCGQLKKSDHLDENPSSERPTDAEGTLSSEKAKELGGEKAIESAQTLLSMGLNSSEQEDAGMKNPNVIQQHLFNENAPTASA